MDMENQIELERLYNKNQLMQRIRQEFNEPEMIEYIIAKNIPKNFALDFLSQLVVHKRASVSTLVGILHHHFEDLEDSLQACADEIYKAIDADLADFDGIRGQIVMRLDVPVEVHAELDRFQYPLPLVVEPRALINNRDTGYYTSHGSVILKNNHHEDDVCLDHLNRLNKTRYAINPDVVRAVGLLWGKPSKKEDETSDEYWDKVSAYQKFVSVSKDVIEHLLLMSDTFYITHKYDKRGRTYTQGYHVNPQGHDWNKASVEFADKEPVTT